MLEEAYDIFVLKMLFDFSIQDMFVIEVCGCSNSNLLYSKLWVSFTISICD